MPREELEGRATVRQLENQIDRSYYTRPSWAKKAEAIARKKGLTLKKDADSSKEGRLMKATTSLSQRSDSLKPVSANSANFTPEEMKQAIAKAEGPYGWYCIDCKDFLFAPTTPEQHEQNSFIENGFKHFIEARPLPKDLW